MPLHPPLSMATTGPRKLGGLQQYVIPLQAMSATGNFFVGMAIDGDQEINAISYLPVDNIAADPANHWTFEAASWTALGAPNATVVAAVNTSAGGLNGLTLAVPVNFTIAAGRLLAGETLIFTFTLGGGVANLTEGAALVITTKRCSTY